MKIQNNSGIHVFEKHGKLDWELELLSMSLLSALSWKKFHGDIHLYANKEYLDTISLWGLDKVYDSIDTSIIETKSDEIDYKKYWAFSKILVIESLKNTIPFTVLDLDLWIYDKLEFDNDSDIMMYHKEDFLESFRNNIYIDFHKMIPDFIKEMDLDKKVLPTNAAILHFNTNKIISEWVDLSKKIAIYNNDIGFNHKSIQMCFVEQRLLPMLLERNNLKYSTFIDNCYLSHMVNHQDGEEWLPKIVNSSEEQLNKFYKIKHVWGLKSLFHNDELRNLVMETVINSLSDYEINDKPYSKLFNELTSKYSYLLTTP